MLKIVTHPLFIKCKKVYESCLTKNHFIIAVRFAELCRMKQLNEIIETKYSVFNILKIEEFYNILYKETELRLINL